MRISRGSSLPHTYHLNSKPLASVSSYKYLGVHITSNLSWKLHVEYVINNANRMLGYLKRNFFLAPSSLKLTMYKSLIRPKLEYAAAVWDPSHSSLISLIESVQNRSARFIMSNYHRTASVSSMKTSLGLPSLTHRRKIFRLCLFHKIFHQNADLRRKLIIPPFYISARIDHSHKVGVPNFKTSLFQYSFIPQTSLDWNHLPASIANITDIVLFKRVLTNMCTL